jgi:hypothetical protein
MPLSTEKATRAIEPLNDLQALRDNYKDVLVVLDYVTLNDVAKHEIDSDAGQQADDILTDGELEGVLWRLGKHTGSAETSHSLLPAMVQYALDEHERRETL